MSYGFAIYLVGIVVVGGFFLGALMTKQDNSNREVGFAVFLGLIWPMTVVGALFAALFRWAERVKTGAR